ncbi:MAG: MerR family transcriptional regulator [Candidatus Marinimicrobia bacterium]|nr:MerR family transcriptional regulator [Candidatus Neomarinimicrobiota bacterium]MCF7840629.1 MerR family transcriptional regulator [Candidatus Neomarinimicrobiota bacterium]
MTEFGIKKLYYSIGEVSKITDLKQYVLRYWESEFPQLSPAKNRAGNRIYRDKDIELILFVKSLLYDRKYTIEGARQKLKEIHDEGLPYTDQSLGEMQQAEPKVQEPVESEDSNRSMAILKNIRQELVQLLKILES